MANLNVDVSEFTINGGRIAHIPEFGGRMVTIAYARNYEQGTVEYGATIYQPGDDAWVRKDANQLATLRATQYPVSIPDNDEWTGRERKEAVRQAMYLNGASSNPSATRIGTLLWRASQ